jgi:hypothetical protein
MFNLSNLNKFPSQKRATSQKGEDFLKSCIDAADDLVNYQDEKVRESVRNKQTNYNLFDDILDENDVRKVCNPFKLGSFESPAKMQNYPLANPKIQLLLGEELKRKFEWRVTVGNDDAISRKEKAKKDAILQTLIQNVSESLKQEGQDDKQIEAAIAELIDINTNYQDDREILATRILSYLWKTLDLKTKFNEGFKDALLVGEEIYCIDIVAGEPTLRRVNPLNLYTIGSGDSPYIEDSDIIIEDCYMSAGQIIDTYYEYLKPNDINRLETGLLNEGGSNSGGLLNYGREPNMSLGENLGGEIDILQIGQNRVGEFYDAYGNIRVVRVVWKSRRKLFELHYFDEFGDEQIDIVDENYKANKDLGEWVKALWVNEWWEGTKIGKDIYVKMQPRPVQLRSMGNLSQCYSGYVGTVYNTNTNKSKSLMDRMKPYQYLYNVFMYRSELAFAKYKGPIYELDISKVPEDWTMEQWLYYAEVMGWAPVDPFNEGKKGAATGKIAGSFNTTGKVLDGDMGGYIRYTMEMLRLIEEQMGKIAGVTPQREGAVSASELVGNVERSVTQSSHITEPLFFIHDNTKLRVLRTLLETAKAAWKGGNKKLQYVLDDLSIQMLTVDSELFNEADYDVHVTNSGNNMEIEQALKQLAHAGLQNDKINFKQLIDIYTSESISAIARKIESAENKKEKQRQEQFEQQQQVEQQKIQAMQEAEQLRMQLEQAKIELDRYKIDSDNMTKIRIAEINSYMRQKELDQNNNGVPDPIEIGNMALKEQELFSKERESLLKIQQKDKENNDKLNLEREKLKSQKEIEAMKLEQVKVQNKNQEYMQDKQIKLKEKELANKLAIEKQKARNSKKQ